MKAKRTGKKRITKADAKPRSPRIVIVSEPHPQSDDEGLIYRHESEFQFTYCDGRCSTKSKKKFH
jgi:hypothetical protein